MVFSTGIGLIWRCPSCDNEHLVTNQTEYDVEHFGRVVLSVATCQRCGYKHADILTMASREPIALTARIDSLEDLNMRVIKSGTATVIIPEFRATITPGPYGEGYLSNVEGVLERVEDALTFMLSSAKGKRLERGKKMLKRIELAKERGPHFTLVIKDPMGNSALVSADPTKVKKRRLTKQELLRIKFGQYALEQKTTQ